jgi:hypothetical protein
MTTILLFAFKRLGSNVVTVDHEMHGRIVWGPRLTGQILTKARLTGTIKERP